MRLPGLGFLSSTAFPETTVFLASAYQYSNIMTTFIFRKFKDRPKKFVSGNAGDEKNLHPGCRKFIFLNRFSGNILFSSLVSFVFLYSWVCFVLYSWVCFVFVFFCLFFFVFFWLVCLFNEIKILYSDPHSTMRVDEW